MVTHRNSRVIDNYIYYRYYLLPVNRLLNFNIAVGPYHGTYKKCGSSINNMSIKEWKGFVCESNAKGISVEIGIKGKKHILSICEVFISGTGVGELNILIVS